MKIRAAIAEEADALSQLAVEAKAKWGYSHPQLIAWKDALTLSASSTEQLPTFVVEVGGEIAGFYQVETSSSPWELEHFWVRPRFMGQGIGRAMLSHAMALGAQAGVAELAIDSDPNAEAFYLTCGAKRVGVIAAPTQGDPSRVRPQLRLTTKQPTPGVEPTPASGRG